MNLLVLKKTPLEELPLIRKLAVTIWPTTYKEILTQEQMEYMLEKSYSLRALKTQYKEGNEFFFILWEDKRVGFISSQNREEDTFIHKFYLLPAYQGKGIGREAFRLWLNQVGATLVRLNVNRYNILAINFYFSLGMRIEKWVDIAIGEGYFMNDFVMKYNSADLLSLRDPFNS
jgi:RimJ/RimL family protein N-acetyltransferase